MNLSVREMEVDDVHHIVEYWHGNSPEFMRAMGADADKVPPRADLHAFLEQQVRAPYRDKSSLALIWLVDGEPCGHCNVNAIEFGEHAFMHLHLWNADQRHRGSGTALVRLSLPIFFDRLELEVLYSEPYALNPAPNKALERAGFRFVKEHVCIPGSLNFEQRVNRWEMRREWLEGLSQS